jgi:hypothetical protein
MSTYNYAHNNESNNCLGFGSSVLAIGVGAHSFASVRAFNGLVGSQMYSIAGMAVPAMS